MIYHVIGEIFSIFAAIFLWISISRPTQRKILLWQCGESLFRIAATAFLGSLSGAAIYLTAIIRNGIILSENEKFNRYSTSIILLIQLILGMLTFHAWYDIVAILAGMEYTLFLKNKDARFTKKNLLVNLILWDIYAIFLGGIVMILTMSIMVVTSAVDLYCFCKKEKNKEEKR